MAVAFDVSFSGQKTAFATSFSWTHTPNVAGSLGVVGVSSVETPSSVTWGGTTMTLLSSAGPDAFGVINWIYYVFSPPNSAQTIQVSFTSSTNPALAGSTNFTGSDLTTPFGTAANATDTGTSHSLSLTGAAAGNLSYGVISTDGSSLGLTAGAVDQWNLSGSGWDADCETRAGAAGATLPWTTASSIGALMLGVVILQPGAPATPWVPHRMPLGA
jgi:hypothetical protein